MNPLPSTTHKKRFLILTSDSGFGHRSAANSIAKALTLQHPQEVTAFVVNPILEEPASPLLKKTELNYDHTVKKGSNFYRFTYEISDSRPASALVENTLTLAMYKTLKQLIQKNRPDVILSTTQMFNAPVSTVIGLMKDRPLFYMVVTDLADVHSLWFNSHPDRFFVASESVRSKAIASGISPQKICISGIPVNPDFAVNHTPKTEIRTKLGLDPHLTTFLIAGSRRVSGISQHLEALEMLTHPFQVVLIAGGDDDLYAYAGRRAWNFPIHVENYVTNMPELMLGADVLVTKAGGLILSEGLAAGLPIILIDYLPGQEEGNVHYILDHQAGEIVENPPELSRLADLWLSNGQALFKRVAASSRRLGHPEAAFVIADALWQAAEKDVLQTASFMRV